MGVWVDDSVVVSAIGLACAVEAMVTRGKTTLNIALGTTR